MADFTMFVTLRYILLHAAFLHGSKVMLKRVQLVPAAITQHAADILDFLSAVCHNDTIMTIAGSDQQLGSKVAISMTRHAKAAIPFSLTHWIPRSLPSLQDVLQIPYTCVYLLGPT